MAEEGKKREGEDDLKHCILGEGDLVLDARCSGSSVQGAPLPSSLSLSVPFLSLPISPPAHNLLLPAVLGIELRASRKPGQGSTTELHAGLCI